MSYRLHDIFSYYSRRLNQVITEADNKIKGYEQNLVNYEEEVNDNIHFILKHSNYNKDKSFAWNVVKIVIFYKQSRFLHSREIDRFRYIFNGGREALKQIKKLRQLKSKAEAYFLPISDFTKILRTFNTYVVDDMIKNGTAYSMPFNLGVLFIERARVVRPKIDWNASNKKREAIKARGERPYYKVQNPNGVKWLVYHTNDYAHRYQWSKSHSNVHNKSYFMFVPTRNQNGVVPKLIKYIDNNPAVVHKYTRRETKTES